jgi:hypothetical protein
VTQPLTPLDGPTRALLVGSAILTALASVALLVGAAHTDEAFAWTIMPPLAAAFLGAGYGAGVVLVVLTLRAGTWEQARWPLASVFTFVVLALIATVLHLDKMHLPGPTVLGTSVAWLWLAVYVVVPPLMTTIMVRAERGYRRTHTRSGTTTRASAFTVALLAEGAVLGAAGVALFVQWSPVIDHWPWLLTPFVAQVTGAWLTAFALAAFLASRIDASLLGPGTIAYATFGGLELVALALHTDDVREGAGTVAYVVLAVCVLLTGLWGASRAQSTT